MSAIEEGEDAVRRASWIAGRSRIAAVAGFIVDRSAASVRSSRAVTLARRRLREFQSLSSGERTRCVLIAIGAALAGHVVLAAMLPAPATPTLGLTTVALLGAGVVLARSAE